MSSTNKPSTEDCHDVSLSAEKNEKRKIDDVDESSSSSSENNKVRKVTLDAKIPSSSTGVKKMSADSSETQQDEQMVAKSRTIVKTTRVDGQQVGLRKLDFCEKGGVVYEEFYYEDRKDVKLCNAKHELLGRLRGYCKKEHPQGIDLEENVVKLSVVAAQVLVDFDYGRVFHTISLPKQYSDKQLVAFLNLLNFFYNSGYGTREISGRVWLKDGSWLQRCDYDGAESWKHYELEPIYESLENNDQFKTENVEIVKEANHSRKDEIADMLC